MIRHQVKILQQAALLLLLCVSITLSSADNSNVSQWLSAICKDKRDVQIFDKEQVELLAKEIATNSSPPQGCKESVLGSITSLNEILSIDTNQQLCSQDVADSLTKFYNEYVISSKSKAPAVIRSIFAAFGLKLSQICQERMVKFIKEVQSKSILSAKDNEAIEQWMGNKSPLAYMLSDPKDYDNLVVPRTLTKDMSGVPYRRLAMKYKTVDTIRELQLRCVRRFKPIYEPLIMPLVSLSSIGFSYKGPKDASDNKSNDLSELVFKWYRVFLVCETLGSFSIDVATTAKTDEKDKLSQKMELMIIAPRTDFSGAQIHRDLMSNESLDVEQLVYKPEESEQDIRASGERLHDPIVAPNDADLRKAMEKFKKKAKKARDGCQLANKLVKKLQSRCTRLLYGKAGGSDVQLMIEYLEKGSFKVKQNCVRRAAIGVVGAALAGVFIFGAVLATKVGIDAVQHFVYAADDIKEIGHKIGEFGDIASGATDAINNMGQTIHGFSDTIGQIGSHLPGG